VLKKVIVKTMPSILDLESREISHVIQLPGNMIDWVRAKFEIQVLVNDQNPHYIEWEASYPCGMINIVDGLVLVQDRGIAFDIEYYTRSGGTLCWVRN